MTQTLLLLLLTVSAGERGPTSRPIASPTTQPIPGPENQARLQLTDAKLKLEEARAAVIGRLQNSTAYQQAKAILDSAQRRLATARAEANAEARAQASLEWMNAQETYQALVQPAFSEDPDVRSAETEMKLRLKTFENLRKERLASAVPTTKPARTNAQWAPKQLTIGMTLAQAKKTLGSHSQWTLRGGQAGDVQIYEVIVVDWMPVIFLGNAWMEVDRLIVVLQGGSVVSFSSVGE